MQIVHEGLMAVKADKKRKVVRVITEEPPGLQGPNPGRWELFSEK